MATINYVDGEIEIKCTDNAHCTMIQDYCIENIVEFNSCIINGNILQVFMDDTVETNYMDECVTNFLTKLIEIVQKYDAGAEIEDGTISWKDDFYNHGEMKLSKDGDKYIVSEPSHMDRDDYAIHNALDITLIKELESRGYSVHKNVSEKPTDSKKYWMVKCFGGRIEYFEKDCYDEMLQSAKCLKEDHLAVKVYRCDEETGEYILAFTL